MNSIAYYCIYKLLYDFQFKWRILCFFCACRLIINKLTKCFHRVSPRMAFHMSCGTWNISVTTLSVYCLFGAPVENGQCLLRATLLILTWVILQCLLALLVTLVPFVECRMKCGIATCVKMYFHGLVILWGFFVKLVGVRWQLKSWRPRVSSPNPKTLVSSGLSACGQNARVWHIRSHAEVKFHRGTVSFNGSSKPGEKLSRVCSV